MDWRLKCLAFHVLDRMPFGDDAYYCAQRLVTRRSRRDLRKAIGSDEIFPSQVSVFRRHLGALDDVVYLEFGAGRYLFDSVLNYCHGLNRQIVIDVKALARRELINQVIARFMVCHSPDFVRRPQRFLGRDFIEELRTHYGIEYVAPADARHVDMPDGSINIIATTNTLEHIPVRDLAPIMKECHRLCSRDGIVSMKIDYTDHYSHTDANIGPYNFLSFGEGTWGLLNPRIHYQNRLRHINFRDIFRAAGFSVVEEHYEIPEGAAETLAAIEVDQHFAGYDAEEVMKIYGHFVLRKADGE